MKRPKVITEEDTDPPVPQPLTTTVYQQPRPVLYDSRRRRVERTIGYRPTFQPRLSRDD